MKQTVAAAAFLAVGAAAQNSTSTTTKYYNTCTTTAPATVTDTNTVTWCPPCEAAGMTSFPGGSLTTYVATFKQVCPTDAARLEDATYTITEPCPSTGLSRGPSYVPQGFTVSTVSCSACEAGKSQYAQTTPGPALASALATPAAAPAVPAPAAGAPAASGAAGTASPANAENPAAAPGSSGAAGPAGAASPAAAPVSPGAPAAPGAAGAASPANAENAAALPGSASPAENGATAPGAGSPLGNGAAAPYPLPSQAGQVAAASGAPVTNGTVPFTGTANIISVGISSFITALATLVTGFAFVL